MSDATMNASPGQTLLERLIASAGDVPSHAEVFAVRQYSVDESHRRAKRVLAATADACKTSLDRADWVPQAERTLVRLPFGGRAVIYHASGALKVTTGLAPMDSLFGKVESREALVQMVEAVAGRLGLAEWVGPRESLTFERLWQIKAAAADRERTIEPVLCRVVGAYRQMVGRLRVLGPASAAVKVAAGGAIDAVTLQLREPTGEAIEWAPIVSPAHAARQVLGQLASRLGHSRTSPEQLPIQLSMSFGYVGLGKRSPQRVLAPHYIATFQIEADEAQAYQIVVPATERTFMAFCQVGTDSAPALLRRAG
jgi:hypothetical protein